MKGLILSGGKGTRLRPITNTGAKQLIPVANKPVLFYAIETLVDAGIEDIGIVVGETRREVEQMVGDGSRWGIRLTYIPQEQPLGLAHAILIAEEFLQSDPFVMFLGDNVLMGGIRAMTETYRRERPNSLINLTRVRNPQDFGVAELQDGRIVSLEEKPKEPRSDLALVGIYLFDQAIFQAVRSIRPSWRNELEITDAIRYLMDNGYRVIPHLVTGWWKDTGKLEDILDANRMMLETIEEGLLGDVDQETEVRGRVRIEPGAVVRRSCIRGPAIVGPDACIEDSYIGPFTSIGPQVTICRSEIEHSIVLEGACISDMPYRMEDSLVGRGAVVDRAPIKPKAIKLMIGDHCRVGMV